MDPPEQLRLPMFIVGSMRASEFDVFVVDAGGQLPVSDALSGFVAGDWLPAACRSLFPSSGSRGGGGGRGRAPPVPAKKKKKKRKKEEEKEKNRPWDSSSQTTAA